LLVSHDRDFMDNVITSLVVLDGKGGVEEYVGGYSDWEARGGGLSGLSEPGSLAGAVKPKPNTVTKQKKPAPAVKAKLSYKDRRELGNLPGKIEKLEVQLSQLEEQMATPGFYQSGYERVQFVSQELAEIQAQLEKAFARWDELEALGSL